MLKYVTNTKSHGYTSSIEEVETRWSELKQSSDSSFSKQAPTIFLPQTLSPNKQTKHVHLCAQVFSNEAKSSGSRSCLFPSHSEMGLDQRASLKAIGLILFVQNSFNPDGWMLCPHACHNVFHLQKCPSFCKISRPFLSASIY